MSVTATAPFLDRLVARSGTVGTTLCLGLDPDPDELPAGFSRDAGGVERFADLLVRVCAPHAAAVKPNLAFWEALGPEGMAALERVRSRIPSDVPVVIDAKRGDIRSTAARQAEAIVGRLAADAVTLSPYVGRDALDPFLERGAFAYVLSRTSNPSAADVQDVLVVGPGGDAVPLHVAVARTVESWADEHPDRLGLVVGATDGAGLQAVREAAPSLPFLVPGVGAQSGDAEAALRWGPVVHGAHAPALLVNVSRGIARAALTDEPEVALDAAARDWAARLRVLA